MLQVILITYREWSDTWLCFNKDFGILKCQTNTPCWIHHQQKKMAWINYNFLTNSPTEFQLERIPLSISIHVLYFDRCETWSCRLNTFKEPNDRTPTNILQAWENCTYDLISRLMCLLLSAYSVATVYTWLLRDEKAGPHKFVSRNKVSGSISCCMITVKP